ncbi:hypothetical protein RRG08_006370 [Elysia crispata]|uniref:HAT C-terminal dimerisation domain-containing protein n=1 Tax=Elysia crispata TaxID=231223 RepID=A0AAE0Z9R4_9GAST|nr:hypothetical protein RRG08_006370 [Elysia crispata]
MDRNIFETINVPLGDDDDDQSSEGEMSDEDEWIPPQVEVEELDNEISFSTSHIRKKLVISRQIVPERANRCFCGSNRMCSGLIACAAVPISRHFGTIRNIKHCLIILGRPGPLPIDPLIGIPEEPVDQAWAKIGRILDGEGQPKYSILANIMKGLAVIPHSNASSERVFSLCVRVHTGRGSLETANLSTGAGNYQKELLFLVTRAAPNFVLAVYFWWLCTDISGPFVDTRRLKMDVDCNVHH